MRVRVRMKRISIIMTAILILSIIGYVPLPNALAMEEFNYQSESLEDVIHFAENHKSNIDIKVIGSLNVDTTLNIQYIDDSQATSASSRQALALQSENAVSADKQVIDIKDADPVQLKQAIDQSMISKEIPDIPVSKVDSLSIHNFPKKTNKDDAKALIISNEMIPSVFFDENISNIKDVMEQGYAVYFEIYSMSERDQVYKQLGLFDVVNTYEEDDVKPYAAYVIRNKTGGYYTGALLSNSREDFLEDIIVDIIKTRNYYTSYNESNYVKEESSGGFLWNASADMVSPSSAWTQTLYEDRTSGNYKYGSSIIHSVTNYTTYGYTTHDVGSLHYYCVYSRMFVEPNTSGNYKSNYSKELLFRVKANGYQSSNVVTDYGPKEQPSTNTLGFNLGGGISKNGISGNIGFSYSVTRSDLKISNSEASMTNNIASTTFTYTKILWASSYLKNQSEQQAGAIIRDNSKRGYLTIAPDIQYISYWVTNTDYDYTITTNCGTQLKYTIMRPGACYH